MSNLEKALFQLKFTAKTLQRQAKKANKDEAAEKNKLKAVSCFSRAGS
jgi:charged multivesicular body protein 1